jgi:(p)ppGpp synthase/HD superfamily hydrolase
MEMGYLGPVKVPRGAWEVRWLASHLERTAVELQQTVRRLVAAERRALRQPRPAADPSVVFMGGNDTPVEPITGAPPANPREDLVRQYLADTLRLLSSLDPTDPASRSLARDSWERTALEAEQIGAMEIKARLEDCALRILEPEAFADLERRLAATTASRGPWFREQHRRLERALADAGVPHLGIQRRVKHLAGIWRKMQDKQLELDQVHDVHALRVIVPDEEHCYLALHAVHGAFEPEPFRFKDYIANPKPNGYRSLHTTVRDEHGVPLEVQIRSLAMHQAAERGSAAHWRYKAESLDPPAAHIGLRRFVRRLHRQGAAS